MNETTFIRVPSGKTKSIQEIELGDEILVVNPDSYSTIPYKVSSVKNRKGYTINGFAVGDHVITPRGIVPTYQLYPGDKICRIPFTPTRTIPITVDPYCLGVCSYRNIDPDTSTIRIVPETLRHAYVADAFALISHHWQISARYFNTYFQNITQGIISRDILYAPADDLVLFTRGLLDVISVYNETTRVHTIHTDDFQLLDDIEIICARLLYTCTVEQVDTEIPRFKDTISYWIIQVYQNVEPTFTVKTIENQWGLDIGDGSLVCSAAGIPIQYMNL